MCLTKLFSGKILNKKSSISKKFSHSDTKFRAIDEILGLRPDSRGNIIDIDEIQKNNHFSPQNLSPTDSLMPSPHNLGNSLKSGYKKKGTDIAKPFRLKDFFENPTEENILRLKSMTINELMTDFKNSNIEDKQKFESELIKLKVQRKHEKEVIPILKTITEISRFNSPVVKLKDLINQK